MALINISFDTDQRNPTLTIDGQMVANADLSMWYYHERDGDKSLSFEYTVMVENDQGLIERKTFVLPPKDEDTQADFVEKTELDQNKFQQDVEKFFDKNSEK